MLSTTKKSHHNNANALDADLSSICVRNCYGLSAIHQDNPSLLSLGDDEFIVGTGSNLRIYNDTLKKSKLLQPQIPQGVRISLMALSRDCRQLAVVVDEGNFPDTFQRRERARTAQTPSTAHTNRPRDRERMSSQSNRMLSNKTGIDGQDNGGGGEVLSIPEAKLYIYDLNSSGKRPQLVSYRPEKWTSSANTLTITCIDFSADGLYFAISFDVPELGVLIYDSALLTVVTKVSTTSVLNRIAFHPQDSSKLCTIGHNNTCCMWRIAGNKNAYLSPIHKLTQIKHNWFTCLAWLEPSKGLLIGAHDENSPDDQDPKEIDASDKNKTTKKDKDEEGTVQKEEEIRLLVGSGVGYIIIVQATEQIQAPTWPFGCPPGYAHTTPQDNFLDTGVTTLLHRGDHVIALSNTNAFCILELKKYAAAGAHAATAILLPLQRSRVSGIDSIIGMQWMSTTIQSSYEVVLACPDKIVALETNAGKMGSRAGIEHGLNIMTAAHNDDGADETKTGGLARSTGISMGETPGTPIVWNDMTYDRVLTNYHEADIHSLAMASRTCLIATASTTDESIQVRDFSDTTGPAYSLTSMHGSVNLVSNSLDMHPTGMFLTSGCEDEAIEYIITDNGMEVARKIHIKVPFTLPNGAAFVNMHPVTLVKYSHTGHLLAVVMGKNVQVFHMYDYTLGTNYSVEPKRVMTMTDHTGYITDLAFSSDDSMIFTTASDGVVYSWKMIPDGNNNGRVNEYRNMNAMSANHVVVNDDGQVIVTFIPNTINPMQVSSFAKNKAAVGSANTSRANTGNHQPGMPPSVGTPTGSTPRRRGSFTDAASRKHSFQAPSSHSNPLLHPRTHGKLRKQSISDSPGPSRRPSNFRGMPCTPASGMSGGGGDIEEENPTANVKLESVVMIFDQDVNPDKPEVNAYVYGIITSVCCGLMDTASGLKGNNNIVCFGMLDGSILISKLPLPLMIVNVQLPAMRSMSVILHTAEDSVSHANKTMQSVSMMSGGDGQSIVPSGREKSIADSVHGGSSAAVPLMSKSKTMGALFDDDRDDALPRPSSGTTKTEKRTFLNEAMCKFLQLHTSAVSSVTISTTGLWIFSASHDGSVYMLSTSMRARSLTNENIPEKKTANENNYVVTDKEMLLALRTRLADVDTVIDQTQRESDRIIHKLTEENRQNVFQLEERMKRETSKRDEIIIKTREDSIKQSKTLNKEIAVLKTSKKQEISQLESDYEKRLARENLYLNKMKQAYDEYVVHARLDMADLAEKAEKTKENLGDEHDRAMHDLEKEKSQMLMYIEYVKEQNQSVIAALDGSQEEERRKFGEELTEAKNGIENATRAARSEIAQLQIDIQRKDFVITKKEDDVLKMQADLGWANERIKKLETALSEASTAIGKKGDLAEHWEFKVGEQQQQIVNLEKVRKALTTQLHSLRQELAPEREKLSEVTDKLSEVDREYELSLQSISEKEEEIVRRGSSLNLLQKQIRDLRYTTSQKERALMRAAKVLGEYQLALREAQFESVKRTLVLGQDPKHLAALGHHHRRPDKGDGEGKGGDDSDDKSHISRHSASGGPAGTGGLYSPGNEKAAPDQKIGNLVEIMKVTPHMVKSLTTLQNLLAPYESGGSAMEVDDEIVQAVQERERHVTQLHQTVNQLKSSLNNTEETAIVKVKKSLSDNQLLLEELNHLRTRTKRLNQENQRQKATIEMMKIQQNISAANSTASLTHNRKYRDGGTLENSFQEGTNQISALHVELPSGINASQTTGQDFNYYAGSLSLSEEVNIAAVAERTSKKVQKQTQGIKVVKTSTRHTMAAARPPKKDAGGNDGNHSNTRSRHNTIAATGGSNNNDVARMMGMIGGSTPLQSPLDNFQSGPALNENSIVSVDSNQPKGISLSRYLDDEREADLAAETNSVIVNNNNKNETGDANFKPSSSQLSADEKIAQIMAENDKKIKEMRANNSADDILSYYQTQLKTPPMGSAGKNNTPGSRGAGKQQNTTTKSGDTDRTTGSAGAGKEVKMRFIKGRDIALPDIDNKQL